MDKEFHAKGAEEAQRTQEYEIEYSYECSCGYQLQVEGEHPLQYCPVCSKKMQVVGYNKIPKGDTEEVPDAEDS